MLYVIFYGFMKQQQTQCKSAIANHCFLILRKVRGNCSRRQRKWKEIAVTDSLV